MPKFPSIIDSSIIKKNPVCGICLEDLLSKPIGQVDECAHLFHHECLHQWSHRGDNTCPHCKRRFSRLAEYNTRLQLVTVKCVRHKEQESETDGYWQDTCEICSRPVNPADEIFCELPRCRSLAHPACVGLPDATVWYQWYCVFCRETDRYRIKKRVHVPSHDINTFGVVMAPHNDCLYSSGLSSGISSSISSSITSSLNSPAHSDAADIPEPSLLNHCSSPRYIKTSRNKANPIVHQRPVANRSKSSSASLANSLCSFPKKRANVSLNCKKSRTLKEPNKGASKQVLRTSGRTLISNTGVRPSTSRRSPRIRKPLKKSSKRGRGLSVSEYLQWQSHERSNPRTAPRTSATSRS